MNNNFFIDNQNIALVEVAYLFCFQPSHHTWFNPLNAVFILLS